MTDSLQGMHIDTVGSAIKASVADAKIALLKAETAGQLIDNKTAAALALTAEIAAERERKTAEWEDMANSRHREYHFTDSVDVNSVTTAIDTLTRWHRLDTEKGDNREYKFVICSPGGAVVPGMKLYAALKALATKRPLVTVASGMCASMATVIHQAGSLRVIEPGCSYLLHDVAGESFGSLGTMQDTMDWLNKLNSMLHQALAEKASITLDEVAALGKRRDGWFTPAEILGYGLADVLGYAFDATSTMAVPKVKPIKPRVSRAKPAAKAVEPVAKAATRRKS